MSETMHGHFDAQPERGAWLLREPKGTPDIMLFANADCVDVLCGVAIVLAVQGYTARIVVVDDMERFCAQEESYRRMLFPENIPAKLGLYRNPAEKEFYAGLTTRLMPVDSTVKDLERAALEAMRD